MHRDPPHYLKPLKTTQVPKRLAYFDVQSKTVRKGRNSERTWDCGTIATTHYARKDRERRDRMVTAVSPNEIWEVLDRFCLPRKRVVAWTYDLPEQLRTSGALVHLPKIGWHLETVVLEPGASWAKWRNGDRSLLMCDLKSWTPYEWERINNAMVAAYGHGDSAPADLSRNATLSWNRCRVIRSAVSQILEWIEAENLGTFKPTGSGQSYGAFRRRWLSDRILVHDDIARLSAERRAMWTGRVEAWRHGRLYGGPFLELDMRAAYARIAAECAVPTVALGEMSKPTLERVLAQRDRYAFLCHVEIETEVPCVPCSSGTHTFWPVGKFDTWLYDPELELLASQSVHTVVKRAYKYRTQCALSDFASYVLGQIDTLAYEHGTMPQLVMKHWSRSLVGRFGLRYRSWIPFADNDETELSMVTFIDYDDNTMTDMLCVGTDMLLLGELTESVESVPQIPGWIMSECRRRLWTTMCEIGLENIVYVDTDSIIVDLGTMATGERDLLNRYRGLWARKNRLTNLTIHGPRNLHADTDRRVSGLPVSAVQSGPTEFRGEVMQSIKQSMRNGRLDTVTTIPRKFMFTAPDIRRGHNDDGTTFPFHLDTLTQSTEV